MYIPLKTTIFRFAVAGNAKNTNTDNKFSPETEQIAEHEMTDFLHDGVAVNHPNNAQEIYLDKLGSESPMLVKLIMKSIYKQNKREIENY